MLLENKGTLFLVLVIGKSSSPGGERLHICSYRAHLYMARYAEHRTREAWAQTALVALSLSHESECLLMQNVLWRCSRWAVPPESVVRAHLHLCASVLV